MRTNAGAATGIVLVVCLGLAACTTSSAAPPPPDVAPQTVAIAAAPPSVPDPPTTIATSTTTQVSTTTTALPSPVRLVFTGEVLMHSPLWAQALRNGGGTVHDFTAMFEHLRPIIDRADLAVCHLETPIAPPGEAYSTSPLYGVPAEVVDAVAAAGFDHCSTASNHTFDRGVAGVVATADRFEQVGITQHGMARQPADAEPVLIDVAGLVVAHLSATYGFDAGQRPRDEPWRSSLINAEQIIADATAARVRGAEFVAVSLHWGNSNSHRVSERQRTVAEALAASGQIDLVVGHHSHLVQPVEQVGNMWVAFGLGNLISNLPVPTGIWTEASRDGAIVEVVVERNDDDTDLSIGRPTVHAVWVDRDAGWVVRDVATALRDPELVARLGPQLTTSWKRTAAVMGDIVVAP
jgi:poly-gamma-glutamate capsule biosynthesis protein CapA/YwtB (metallophosphatase superfamily)